MEGDRNISVKGTENKSLEHTNTYEIIEGSEWIYSLTGFLLLAFLSCELGNISLCISLFKKRLETVTAVFVSSITASGIITGTFVLLPMITALAGRDWLLGYAGCVIQGVMGNVGRITKHIFMLCLAYERYSVVVKKQTLEQGIRMSRLLVVIVFLFAAIIGSLPLIHVDSYQYTKGAYECILKSNLFSILFDVCSAVIPALTVIFLTISSVVSLDGCPRRNQVMEFDMAPGTTSNDMPMAFERRSRLRASLFPRHSAPREGTNPPGVSTSERKATMAVAYFNIPLAILSLISFTLNFTALTFSLERSRFLLLTISMLITVSANVAQPYILLGVSSALRKAFINFLRGKRGTVTPTFNIIGVPTIAKPREDISTINEMPEYLRSSMHLEVQMSSSVDLNQHFSEAASDIGSSVGSSMSFGVSTLAENDRTDLPTSISLSSLPPKNEDRRVSCITRDSLDSVFVRVGTSHDVPNRWSVSTGSIITLDLPEYAITPFFRPRSSNVNRTTYSNNDSVPNKRRHSSTTPKRPKSEEIPRRQTIQIPPQQLLTSPYNGNKRQIPFRSFDSETNVLPTVLSSKETTPRVSEQMTTIGCARKETDEDFKSKVIIMKEKDIVGSNIYQIEITDLTAIEGSPNEETDF